MYIMRHMIERERVITFFFIFSTPNVYCVHFLTPSTTVCRCVEKGLVEKADIKKTYIYIYLRIIIARHTFRNGFARSKWIYEDHEHEKALPSTRHTHSGVPVSRCAREVEFLGRQKKNFEQKITQLGNKK